ncbi:MAG: SdiA-regulated domain-containing protein, partial [Candidatus Accumulibacter sp.]|nr:SdiA-regulated domain-containing protein [Accumulibacter sp.]
MLMKSKMRRWLFAALGVIVLTYVWPNCVDLGKTLALRGVAAWAAREPASMQKVGLEEYRAVIEARPIAGVSAQASALTYNPLTKTLFITTNRPAQVVELSTEGEMLRKIPIAGLHDLEGIAHIEGDLFALADECCQRIYWTRLDADTRELNADDMAQLELGVLQGKRNRGFEGLAWDAGRQRLLAVNEKNPARVIEISGFPITPSR